MTDLKKNARIMYVIVAFALLLVSCNNIEESSYDVNSSVDSSIEINNSSDYSAEISEEMSENNMVDVLFNASQGGYVTGNVKQSLSEGELTKYVTAQPVLCYKFKGWSDGVSEPTRKDESFLEDTVITAIFEYSGLPELHIEYSGYINKRNYINATYTMKNTCDLYGFQSYTGKIQGRGNSSWNHAKRPYKIKFDEAVNLLGIGREAKRDWVIMANHGDQSLFRNYFAYNIAYKAGIGYKSTLIEVYLNGKYNGVYMLTGKVEESRLGVDASENGGGFIVELDEYATGKEDFDYFWVGKERYTVKSDHVSANQVKKIKSSIADVEAAIKAADEEKIKELVDIDSCIDMYLLQEYVKNTDVGWSSFYMYKRDENDKLRFGPAWDFDIAMGNDYRLDKGSYENIYVGRYSGFYQQSWWYIYLCRMEWFRELALNRWNTSFYGYVEETLSELKSYAEINWDELENNFVRWKIFGKKINSEPVQIVNLRSYLEHYRYFIAWTELRLEWLDNCFNDNESWLKEVNDRTYPQYKGGKIPEIEPDPDAPDLPESSEEDLSQGGGLYDEMEEATRPVPMPSQKPRPNKR